MYSFSGMATRGSIFHVTRQHMRELASRLTGQDLLILAALVFISTRLFTGIRSRFPAVGPGGLKIAKPIPYWIPYIGHALSLGLCRQRFLEKIRCVRPNIDPSFALCPTADPDV
jgi:hypothetical protein